MDIRESTQSLRDACAMASHHGSPQMSYTKREAHGRGLVDYSSNTYMMTPRLMPKLNDVRNERCHRVLTAGCQRPKVSKPSFHYVLPRDGSIGYSSIAASIVNGPSLVSREVYFVPEIDIKRGSINLLFQRSTKEQNEEEITTRSKTYETDF